jgi:uncharacterized protein with von Willebrand factor type A (vWA) domain
MEKEKEKECESMGEKAKAELEYYKCNNNNKYLATIDLSQIKSSQKVSDSIFICLLDKSGSMEDNVYIYVKEIFPLV